MEISQTLTEKQQAVYEFIREKIRSRGYGPTVREIGRHFGIRSPNGVVCHLKALEKKGDYSRAEHVAGDPIGGRAVEDRRLPLAGRIAAGVLHEAIEQNERVDFDEMFDPADKDLFLLQVNGDSMIEDQIADGDFVVVRRQKTARKGQIVVAITDEGEATLKRWFPERNRIRLEPANSTMKPIYVRNAQVLGVVVGVIRKVG